MRNFPGVCLWFIGPSGAGKSTATAQLVPMLEARGRTVTVLDIVPELAKHWAECTSEGKLVRKAFVAREIVRHGGITICLTATGRAGARDRARDLVGAEDSIEVYFDAPIEVTARRRAARRKRTPLLKQLRRALRRIRWLGRRQPGYQKPTAPDLTVKSLDISPEEIARRVVDLLVDRGLLQPDRDGEDSTGPSLDESGTG